MYLCLNLYILAKIDYLDLGGMDYFIWRLYGSFDPTKYRSIAFF